MNGPEHPRHTMRAIALTAIGRDRPGIVAGVSRVLYEAGANLRDTSMTILSGQFAMIVVADVPADVGLDALERALTPVRRDLGVQVFLQELAAVEAHAAAAVAPPGEHYLVTVMGADRPGIVYRVTEAMARRGINITDLDTRIVGEDRTPVYVMMMEVSPPAGTPMEDVRRELEALGRSLSVEVGVRPLEDAAL